MKEVVIVSYTRTPIGSFGGRLSTVSATKLGSIAIKGAIEKINLDSKIIDEVFMGNVISSGLGQAPAKQAAIYAGISNETPCTTINKVCSSGLKAVMIGAQSIQNGDNDIIIAGGMENMSAIPFYLNDMRGGKKLGHTQINDGLLVDGLTDVYDNVHMGVCAEICAEENQISREEQDEFALKSYEKSNQAWTNGFFNSEITPVKISTRKGDIIIDHLNAGLITVQTVKYMSVLFAEIDRLRLTEADLDRVLTQLNLPTEDEESTESDDDDDDDPDFEWL